MKLTGFDGTLAVVTGAAGGIGAALVQLLLDSGCVVVATDLAAPALPAHRLDTEADVPPPESHSDFSALSETQYGKL